MRVGIASSGLGHVARGIEAWATDLAAALAARGVDVTLYRGSGRGPHAYESTVGCLQRDAALTQTLVRLLPKPFLWRLGLGSDYAIEQTTFALALLPRLAADRIDILHVQDPWVTLVVQRARAAGLVPTRVILGNGTEEPPEYQRRIVYLQHLAPWHLEESRGVGVWRPSWTAIPNFIDTDVFQPGRDDALRAELDLPTDAVVILAAAAIKRHHKRIDHLIDEFARLRADHPDLPAWLVVAGGREAGTGELVALGRERLGERVRFLIAFPRERMPRLYRAADIFTLASLKEMMPIALLEACGSGLPCVVNPHPVMAWMVGPGGVTPDMTQPGAHAAALAELVADGERRAELGLLAREHCLRHFSRERVVDQILTYYRRVSA